MCLVSRNWVELEGAVLKSRAKIAAGHKILFRFCNKRGLCEMVYERRVAEIGATVSQSSIKQRSFTRSAYSSTLQSPLSQVTTALLQQIFK